ncbi:diguanylate cyclase [Desulforhopalus sp. 52FAK]
MTDVDKRRIIIKIVSGYLLALSLMLGIVGFSLNRLNKIEKTVDDITNRLAVTRALSQAIAGKIRQVRFNAERYQRFYHQSDLDQFNEEIIELKSGLEEINHQVNNNTWLEMIQHIQDETDQYETHFENIVKLIMYQQSLLSTVFIKQELLIENQLSAIRINVGIVQAPDIFFSFGNARNSFQLMRLSQAKYLNEANEKYFVMFKNNYKYATEAFNNLNSALMEVSDNAGISANAIKANEELEIYYHTFLKIRSASIDLRKASRDLDKNEFKITEIATDIGTKVEEEYQVQNKVMQSLVLRTQVELVVAVLIAISLSLGLIIVVSRKITTPIFLEMQKRATQLEQLANSDGLTGLANRRLLDERLTLEWQRLKREKKPLSIVMTDVDQFKAYNDFYGHQQGDDCLIKVAQAILACLKRPGDLAGRYGGEEFMVILPNTNTAGAIEVTEGIQKTISDIKIEHLQSEIADYLTLSFGVASVIPSEKSTPEELLSLADDALYAAKRQGRNQISIGS